MFLPVPARAVSEDNVWGYWPLNYGAGGTEYRECAMTGIFATTTDCRLIPNQDNTTDVQGKFGGTSDARYSEGDYSFLWYNTGYLPAQMPAADGEWSFGWWQKTSYDYGTTNEQQMFSFGDDDFSYSGMLFIWGTKHNGGHTKLNLQYRRSSTDWANLETLNDFNFVFPDDGEWHNYIITGKFGTGFQIYKDGTVLDTQWWRGNASSQYYNTRATIPFYFWGYSMHYPNTSLDDVWTAYEELPYSEFPGNADIAFLQTHPFGDLFLPTEGDCSEGCQVSFDTLEKGFNGANLPNMEGYCLAPGWKHALPPFEFQSLGGITYPGDPDPPIRIISWYIGTSTCSTNGDPTGSWIPFLTGSDAILDYISTTTPLGIQPICWELIVSPDPDVAPAQFYYATSSIKIYDADTAPECQDIFSPYNEENLPWCFSEEGCVGLEGSYKCALEDLLCWLIKPVPNSTDFAISQLTRTGTHFPLNTYTTLFRDLTLMATGTQYQKPGTVVMPDYNLASHTANQWGLGSTTLDFSTDTPETADLKKLFYPKEKYIFYALAACACSLLVIKFL
jgi:hypothetical protein